MRLLAAWRLLALVAVMALLWGCGKKAEKKPYSPPLKIAVCFDDIDRDGNKIIKKVMQKREKQDNLEIIWLDAQNDKGKQAEQLEGLAGKKVKGAIVQFMDPAAGAEAVRGMVEKNIKVVALESLPQDSPVDAYVASDHLLAGQLLAGFAVNTARKAAGLPVLPGSGGNNQEAQGQQKQQGDRQGQTGPSIPPGRQLNGKVPIGAVLLTGDPRNAMSGEIAASVRTNLQGSKEVSLLSEETVPQNDPAQVPAVLQKVLSAYGSSVQAVLATDSRLAVAAVQALKSAGLNNRVLTAGVGADEESSRALESGDHDAEIDTRPDLLGQFALDAAISLVKGDRWQYDGRTSSGSYSVPSRITPVRLIQGDNVYLLKQQWKGLGGGSEKKEGGDSGDSGQSQGSGDGQKQGSGNEGGQQGSESKGDKTTLRITTQDGKTMEVEIDGKVKKIESTDGGKDGQQGLAGEGR